MFDTHVYTRVHMYTQTFPRLRATVQGTHYEVERCSVRTLPEDELSKKTVVITSYTSTHTRSWIGSGRGSSAGQTGRRPGGTYQCPILLIEKSIRCERRSYAELPPYVIAVVHGYCHHERHFKPALKRPISTGRG